LRSPAAGVDVNREIMAAGDGVGPGDTAAGLCNVKVEKLIEP
jgi:hypothetical protein